MLSVSEIFDLHPDVYNGNMRSSTPQQSLREILTEVFKSRMNYNEVKPFIDGYIQALQVLSHDHGK